VPKLLNAIHVSVFVAMGFFFFISKQVKKTPDYIAILILAGFILLLSAKNIIFIVIFLSIIQLFYFSRLSNKLRLKNLIVFILLIVLVFSYGKIKDRFEDEFKTNTEKSLSTNVIEGIPNQSHYVSINEAWTNKTFTANDYFNGTAFRVYQFRIFLEMLSEDGIFWEGYGLNASYPKIESKGRAYHVYLGDNSNDGYQKMNFHNQYVQNFADLGVLGFLLIVIMLFVTLKNAIKTKDFMHFAFAFLMISLFLTESFLWRQRGVVFFTVLYCLFNTTSKPSISQK
jgi:O-antigen ligase